MIDIHTHILPGVDDGALDVQMSLEMLRMEKAQFVHTVVLTPHFYRDTERLSAFLQRRKNACDMLFEAIDKLPKQQQDMLPRTIVGAEVAWVPNLLNQDGLDELFIGNGKYVLLELPFLCWTDEMIHQMYNLQIQTGVTPIIAHFERYFRIQKTKMIDAVLDMGFPIQIGTDHFIPFSSRQKVLKMLKKGFAQVVASDCHNLTTRPPNLFAAMQIIEKKLGGETVRLLQQEAAELIAE